jgi:signal transduction histidine kinase
VVKQTILIVDDESINIKLVKAYLLKEGYHFISASDGEEALAVVNNTIPDLILLDVMMPGIDGFEVCRRLKSRKRFQKVPIIMVTALTETEHKVKAMEVGADDFISKPLARVELLIRVKSLLRIKSYHDDLQRSYHEISQINDRLKELEKVKEGLIHMVIHDLNNFFMAISGNLELMSIENEQNPAKMKRYISNCLNSSCEIEGMIRGLLDIHKMEEGKLVLEKKEINLESLVKKTLAPLEQIAKKNKINLTFSNGSRETLISVDPGLIKRVMANLLSNALRHTPRGGKIGVEINPDPKNGSIWLSVNNTGKGLPPEYHEAIFEKFEQVNLKEKGVCRGTAGLGLSFCKMAVEAHQGKIWVESQGKGKGCTFKVALPIKTDL